MIRNFTVNIEAKILDNLKIRLRENRWPDAIENSGWIYGSDIAYMKELTSYWMNDFEWKKTEQEINKYQNYIADIEGYKIHFVQVKSQVKNAFPILLIHGWPGSFLEMYKLLPLLCNASDFAFDLVIPSMPGFGFSEKITKPGCNVSFMADLFAKLMLDLDYSKYGVHGGDFGSGVASFLALNYEQYVTGIHLNYIPGNYEPELDVGEEFTSEEKEYLESEENWYQREGGYSLEQNTKPLTLSYALNDSPVGLCAWILEKYYSWSDCKGNIENVYTKDELLSNITLYWITETIHSSIRLYGENRKLPLRLGKKRMINVPLGISRFKFEEPFPPRKFIERGYSNLCQWSEYEEGGHFAAQEKPELLARDIGRFFTNLL